MITDNLSNLEQYAQLNNGIKIVADFLKNHNLAEFEAGKYQIDQDKIFVNVNEYETKQDQKLEAHKKYIDIQVMLKGEEYMGYTNIINTTQYIKYNEDQDVMFLKGNVDKILATADNFFIFFPQDAHKPALCVDNETCVKKAIFKILK